MRSRNAFRPAACDTLEDRLVPSGAGLHSAPLHAAAHAHTHTPAARPASGRIAVGALGDSYTDEYFSYPPDRSRARNWVEVLAATRHLDFGTFHRASQGDPRGAGFAYDWALAGATSGDMVRDQLPGLAAQVAAGQVNVAWIFVGADDFLYQLAEAKLTGQGPSPQLTQQLGLLGANLRANFTTAVDTLLAASPSVRLVVATVPDLTMLPIVQQQAAGDPASQALVAQADQQLAAYNALVRSTAASNDRVALADLQAQAAQLFARAPGGGPIPFGGIALAPTAGDNYHDAFVADGIHAGTVVQGVIADAFLSAIDTKFAAGVRPLSEPEIVRFAARVNPRVP